MNRQGQDRRVFDELIRFLNRKKTSKRFPDRLVMEIGLFFLETPYGAGTLETKRAEHLVVNLSKLDCTTFIENVVALAWHVASREESFEAFRELLRKIRYRRGRLQGYSSRLHYFSDWIRDNQEKGIVTDVTAEIGGRPLRKTMNFMTTHPDLYPRLRNVENHRRMRSVERAVSSRPLFFIPKKDVRHVEDQIRDGDLVAITTNTEGLDVEHAGLAARVKNRIHLLHASSMAGKVILSRQTLYRYLMQSGTRSGIMVARVVSHRFQGFKDSRRMIERIKG